MPRLRCRRQNRWPPAVLRHARGEAYSGWAPVAEALVPSWRVYALDQRGRGASDWPR
jgi:pimeloyl-ACP methyl ester carboxylesterase